MKNTVTNPRYTTERHLAGANRRLSRKACRAVRSTNSAERRAAPHCVICDTSLAGRALWLGIYVPEMDGYTCGGCKEQIPNFQPEAATDTSVPPEWCLESWLKYLRNMAQACQQIHPARAAELRKVADECEKKSKE